MRKIFKVLTIILGKNICVYVLKQLSNFSRKFAFVFHQLQFKYEWEMGSNPEWFDHFLDQFYLFRKTQNPLWVERGTFNLLAIQNNANILELCCGDGFNTYHFYSIRANSITSVDFDLIAIQHAKMFNQAPNIKYQISDIRTQMPEGSFDNILWDAAIEHFTEIEIDSIMQSIKKRLTSTGILSGYTIVESENGKSLEQHEYEFKSKEDLARFFEPHFKNVKVFETIYPQRHNLYFFVSDGILPFDKDWDFGLQIKK